MAEYWSRDRSARVPLATSFFSDAELDDVARFYASAPEAPATPLVRLPGLADSLGLAEVLVKDESRRFGLPAFKITGVRYAVDRLLREPGARVNALACATSGNHGRAVARAARLRGLPAHIYVPAGTSRSRVDALAAEGADVVVSDVGYDDTVHRMRREAEANAWTVVSDTGWSGYEQVPRWIMAGYTLLLEEAAAAWSPSPPQIVVVQAGVGSLAGGVAGWLAHRMGADGPALVVAEPVGAGCVRASLAAGRRTDLAHCAATDMVGLRCGVVSPVAWPALETRVDAAVGVTESEMHAALATYAEPATGDPRMASAASGAAGLAALLALMRDPALAALRDDLAISGRTRVLLFNTEGATDQRPGCQLQS
jgi:diaminopropionate ammonia-lyase